MKKRKLYSILSLAFLIFILATSTVLAAPSSITGHWTAIDPIDGDTVHMILSGGPNGTYRLRAFDVNAPLACPATGGLGLLNGTATFDAGTGVITKTVVASCPSEGITYPENTLDMQYDPSSDTIYDANFDLLYTR